MKNYAVCPANITPLKCCECGTGDEQLYEWHDGIYCCDCLWSADKITMCESCYDDFDAEDILAVYKRDSNDIIQFVGCYCNECAYDKYEYALEQIDDNKYLIVEGEKEE